MLVVVLVVVLVEMKQKQKNQNDLADSASASTGNAAARPGIGATSGSGNREDGKPHAPGAPSSYALGALVVAPASRPAKDAALAPVNHPHGAQNAPHVLNGAAVPCAHWRGFTAVCRKGSGKGVNCGRVT